MKHIKIKDSLSELNNLEAVKTIEDQTIVLLESLKNKYLKDLEAGNDDLAALTKKKSEDVYWQNQKEIVKIKADFMAKVFEDELQRRKIEYLINGLPLKEDHNDGFTIKYGLYRGFMATWQHSEGLIQSGITTIKQFSESMHDFTVYLNQECDSDSILSIGRVLYKIGVNGKLYFVKGNYDTSD